jgi:hypothetical protein
MDLPTILLMLAAISPGAEKMKDARAIAVEVWNVAETPREAATLLVTAWEESRFQQSAVGDGGQARTAYQLHGAPRTAVLDIGEATRIASARLRASARLCPRWPLAVYASGSCDRGHRLNDRRMAEIVRIEQAVVDEPATMDEWKELAP